MQHLYWFTYHWIYIFSTRHILATLELHDPVVILVYLPLDVYIFHSSYTCNTRTARCSHCTRLLTIGCIYFPLIIYLQHSDCTMQRLYLFAYHWMYIFSTRHLLQHSDCTMQQLVNVRIWYLLYIATLDCLM